MSGPVGRFDADQQWRRGRVRDVVAVRELILELFETLSRGLPDRDADIGDLFHSHVRSAFEALPSSMSP